MKLARAFISTRFKGSGSDSRPREPNRFPGPPANPRTDQAEQTVTTRDFAPATPDAPGVKPYYLPRREIPHNESRDDPLTQTTEVNEIPIPITAGTTSTSVSGTNDNMTLATRDEGSAGEIEKDLHNLMIRRKELDKRMILYEDIKYLWQKKKRIKFYQSWCHDEGLNISDYYKILSILVLSRFQRWEEFEGIFSKVPNRRDRDLPFDCEALESDDFLGQVDGSQFNTWQWVLCPLVIQERRSIYLLDQEPSRRFPFLPDSKEIGKGATCFVTREAIAPYHFESSNKVMVNAKEKLVACKHIAKDRAKEQELRNLNDLRRCLSNHDRVMVNIATFSCPNEFIIMYDLAEYDLEKFLVPEGDPMESNPFTAADLIQEAAHLADALQFLHSHLSPSAGEVACAHNDLKPSNILVFRPQSPDDEYPVGMWKITDFGIARLKPKRSRKPHTVHEEPTITPPTSPTRVTHSSIGISSAEDVFYNAEVPDMLHPDEANHRIADRARRFSIQSASSRFSLSKTEAKRDPGRFTAPEVVKLGEKQIDARLGDVWSFACILSEVLVFSIDRLLVKDFRDKCFEINQRDERFYDEGTKQLKPGIMEWLENISKCRPAAATIWYRDCTQLIEKVLGAKDPGTRPAARDIRVELHKIRRGMGSSTAQQAHTGGSLQSASESPGTPKIVLQGGA